MVSLADIAFLIIFFFLLSSQFMKDRVQVNLPKLPKEVQSKTQLTVTMDAGGGLFLEGQPVAGDTIVERRNSLENQLKDILAGKTKAEECEVRFKCDKDMKYKEYHPVYEAIGNAGGVISIVHEAR